MSRRRYAIIGLGHRSQMYIDALLGDWRDAGQLVAFCDVNRTRMEYYNDRGEAAGYARVPCISPTSSMPSLPQPTRWSLRPRMRPTPAMSARRWTRASTSWSRSP
jgi:hypothetical protein